MTDKELLELYRKKHSVDGRHGRIWNAGSHLQYADAIEEEERRRHLSADAVDDEKRPVLEGVAYTIDYIDAYTMTFIRRR